MFSRVRKDNVMSDERFKKYLMQKANRRLDEYPDLDFGVLKSVTGLSVRRSSSGFSASGPSYLVIDLVNEENEDMKVDTTIPYEDFVEDLEELFLGD